LDAIAQWSPFEQFTQIKRWAKVEIKKYKPLEEGIQEAAQLLKCKIEDLVPTLKKTIDEGGKEKLATLEKQRLADQIWIRVLEKKVRELKHTDDLNRNLVEAGKSIQAFVVADPELMVANNLLKNIYKSEEDPKLLKIISCNKKYAADIKDCVSKMSVNLKETMEHLVKHEDRLLMKQSWGFRGLNRK
jgi:hypothetical protein